MGGGWGEAAPPHPEAFPSQGGGATLRTTSACPSVQVWPGLPLRATKAGEDVQPLDWHGGQGRRWSAKASGKGFIPDWQVVFLPSRLQAGIPLAQALKEVLARQSSSPAPEQQRRQAGKTKAPFSHLRLRLNLDRWPHLLRMTSMTERKMQAQTARTTATEIWGGGERAAP